MNNLYLKCLFLILFVPTIFYGQISFEQIELTKGSNSSVYSYLNALGDMDGDGDLDVIIDYETKTVWLENIDGQGTFGFERLISLENPEGNAIYPVDIDNDGDLDILFHTSNEVMWIENMDGLGNFEIHHSIVANLQSASSVHYGDLDGDGDLDIVSSIRHSGTYPSLSWFENLDGNGTLGDEQIIASIGYRPVFCADADNDGDLDIFGSNGGKIVWFENLDGNAVFSTQNIIGTPTYGVTNTYDFVISDLDGDGFEDVVVPNGYLNRTQWYQNLGGNFSEIITIALFSNADINYCESGDFNGDGFNDVITSSASNSLGINLKLNDGDGTFTDAGDVLDFTTFGVGIMNTGDIDNDGDIDILANISNSNPFQTYWFENDGFAEFTEEPIANFPVGVKTTFPLDIDQDGDLDIIVGSTAGIYWYENTNGNFSYDVQHYIYIEDSMDYIFLNDFDSDGDMDILGFNEDENELVWFQHMDGLGDFSSKVIISTSFNNPTMASTADIDNDGDLDIVLSSSFDNKVAWYANLDGQGTFGSEQIITSSATGVLDVKIADIDGDGDLDVSATATNDSSIFWYENTNGLGLFSTEHLVSNETTSVKSIDIKDIDGDGDMDILASSSSNGNLSWFENTDGTGNYSLANSITTNLNNAIKVLLSDMDGDGDYDALSMAQGNLKYYENENGLGSFNQNGILITNYSIYSNPNFSIANMDFDGDLDILVSHIDKIDLFKNLGVVGNELNGTVRVDVDSNGCQNNDALVGDVMLTATNENDSFSTFTEVDGSFQVPVNLGDFSTFVEQFPIYYDVSPTSYDSSFTTIGTSETIDFCLSPNASINDLNISIIPLDEPRPGFDTSYVLVYKNIGTTTLDGTVNFEYDNSKLQFTNANATINMQTANTISFDFTNLNPFQKRTIELNFQVFAPPTTSIDDVLIATATVNPITGDYTENDNVYELEQTVIGSFDPNDITCLQGDEVWIGNADKYLHYVIRFQNTGTANAINVRLEQTLDNKLDWSTLQILNLSHRGNINVTNGTNLVANFNDIQLPSSGFNEPLSHGYLAYKIKPKNNVDIGDIIAATASIYFDFNPPIITNTATTTYIENLSIPENSINLVTIYPNPTNGVLEIVNTSSDLLKEISVINISGRVLFSENNLNSQRHQIDLTRVEPGLYLVTIKTSLGVQTVKVMKK